MHFSCVYSLSFIHIWIHLHPSHHNPTQRSCWVLHLQCDTRAAPSLSVLYQVLTCEDFHLPTPDQVPHPAGRGSALPAGSTRDLEAAPGSIRTGATAKMLCVTTQAESSTNAKYFSFPIPVVNKTHQGQSLRRHHHLLDHSIRCLSFIFPNMFNLNFHVLNLNFQPCRSPPFSSAPLPPQQKAGADPCHCSKLRLCPPTAHINITPLQTTLLRTLSAYLSTFPVSSFFPPSRSLVFWVISCWRH